jgi:hypothetical protein
MRVSLAVVLVFATIFTVPIVAYGALSRLTGLQTPGGDPWMFLGSVAVSKLGTAIAFVGIWVIGRDTLGQQWALYLGLWWGMFVLGEVGQAIGPNYSWQEAFAGILSETIYLPLSSVIVARLFPG